MADDVPLAQSDRAVLMQLAREQARRGESSLPLLDLAVKYIGVESEARHVLQRLLVYGLIELDPGEHAKRGCLGAVTEKALLPEVASGLEPIKKPGAGS